MRLFRFLRRRSSDSAAGSSATDSPLAHPDAGGDGDIKGGDGDDAGADQSDESAPAADDRSGAADHGEAGETGEAGADGTPDGAGSAFAATGVPSVEWVPLRRARSWRWWVAVGLGMAVAVAGVAVLSVYIYSIFDDDDPYHGDVFIGGVVGDDRHWEDGYFAQDEAPGWWHKEPGLRNGPAWRDEVGPGRPFDGEELGAESWRRGLRCPYGKFGRWSDWSAPPPAGWPGGPGAPGAAGPGARGWGGDSGWATRGFEGGPGWFGYAPFVEGGPAWPGSGLSPWGSGGSGWFGYAPFAEGGPPWPGSGLDGDDDYAEEQYFGDGSWFDGGEGLGGFGLSLGGLEAIIMWILELLSDPEVLAGLFGLLDGSPGDGGADGLFGPDGPLGELLGFDGDGDGLFGPDGPFGGLLEFEGDADGLFGPDGALGELFGPDGPFGGLLDGSTVEEAPLPGRTSA